MPHPGVVKDYALDCVTPVRYVATALETAHLTGGRVSRADLSTAYFRSGLQVSGDLARIHQNEGVRDEYGAAIRFLIDWVIDDALSPNVREDADGWLSLAVPLAELRYDGRRIVRLVKESAHLESPFDRLTGAPFSENIRARRVPRDAKSWQELRESMQAFGWVDDLPAIVDENWVVIVGHRRLQVAEELGIAPKFAMIRFGSGDAADARRTALAVASNLGGEPLNAAYSRRIATVLYGEDGWSMAKIAELLRVSTMTISRDLGGLTDVKPERGGRGHRSRTGLRALDADRAAYGADEHLEKKRPMHKVAAELKVSTSAVRRAVDQRLGAEAAANGHPEPHAPAPASGPIAAPPCTCQCPCCASGPAGHAE